MTIIFLLIAFVSAIVRLILSRKEPNDKEAIVRLEGRIKELRAQGRIELTEEARELEKGKNIIEKRLKGYPNIHTLLGVLTVITIGLTILIYLYQSLNRE